jgi:MoxR-like ATPase
MESGLSLKETSTSLRTAAKSAASQLVERESLIDLILLSAVAGEHLLIIGPPGTAKSAAVRRVAQVLGGRYFEYLLGRFTEPSELFGPIDLRKLKEGVVETATEGMLPEAEIVFLDEVFLGSTAVLNTLLGVLNERKFRRGHTIVSCPLKVCVAASNQLPDDESLAAFADRFLVRYFVEPVPDSQLESLLAQGWQSDHSAPDASVGITQLERLRAACGRAEVHAINGFLADCIRLLRKENISLSDRRIVKSQRLIAAAAVLDGRENPTEADLWPLLHVITRKEDQASAREILKSQLSASENRTLGAAAEEASQGPITRAHRLIEQAKTLLGLPEESRNRLSIEALGREIDVSFSINTMPQELKAAREELMGALGLVD